MLIFLFLRLHRPQRLHNIELVVRGIRGLTLDASISKIEQMLMLKYRKVSFPKSVSTSFVAHCSQEQCLLLQLTLNFYRHYKNCTKNFKFSWFECPRCKFKCISTEEQSQYTCAVALVNGQLTLVDACSSPAFITSVKSRTASSTFDIKVYRVPLNANAFM